MSTDRELLELAAKAAGYQINAEQQAERDKLIDPTSASLWINSESTAWNPLRDDGDALRLAVKLRLDILHDDPRDNDAWVMVGPNMDCVEDVDGEASRGAATRRAIVRAAAAIGATQKEVKGKQG